MIRMQNHAGDEKLVVDHVLSGVVGHGIIADPIADHEMQRFGKALFDRTFVFVFRQPSFQYLRNADVFAGGDESRIRVLFVITDRSAGLPDRVYRLYAVQRLERCDILFRNQQC